MELALNFGGFYHSIHDDLVDSFVDRNHDFDSEQEQEIEDHCDSVDYKRTYVNYCCAYVEAIKNFLKENGAEVNLEFVELESPKEYNFKTDVIIVKIEEADQAKIIKFIKKDFNQELLEYVKDVTTSYDGYWAFYSYEQTMANKDSKLIEACLTLLAKKINQDIYNRIEELDVEYLN
jgi:hypothetical protein